MSGLPWLLDFLIGGQEEPVPPSLQGRGKWNTLPSPATGVLAGSRQRRCGDACEEAALVDAASFLGEFCEEWSFGMGSFTAGNWWEEAGKESLAIFLTGECCEEWSFGMGILTADVLLMRGVLGPMDTGAGEIALAPPDVCTLGTPRSIPLHDIGTAGPDNWELRPTDCAGMD